MNQYKKQTNPIKLWFAVVFKRLRYDKVFINEIPFPLWSFVLLLFVICSLYIFAFWSNIGKYQILVNEQYGFSIEHPTNWKAKIYGEDGYRNSHDLRAEMWTNPILGFLGPANRKAEIYWIEIEYPTLEKLIEWNGGIHQRLYGRYSELEETKIGTQNHNAYKRIYYYASSSKILHQYYIVHEEEIFLVEFFHDESVDSEAILIFEHMLNSFQIFKKEELHNLELNP